jgi:hypothetical protein
MSATLNGHQATSLRLSMPRTGAWWADVDIADAVDLSGRVTLILLDLTLTGTVVRSRKWAGSTKARVAAGGYGWGKTVPARGYQSAQGLQLAPILSDAARECGETLGPVASASVGLNYGRTRAAASQVFSLLRALPGYAKWWVDDAGVTQIGTRATGLIQTPTQVDTYDAAEGKLIISADALTQIRPGRTLSDPVAGDHEVDAVIWTMDRTKLRGEVWAA